MFTDLMGRVAGRFARVEPRQRAREFVLGLLADLPRKNCWTIAEHAGDASPDGMQHLLARAAWDTDGVRDDLRDYVVEHLGGTGAVLVVDLCRQRTYADVAGGVMRTVPVRWASRRGGRLGGRHSYSPSRKASSLSPGR
jgi:SRSO17 transposase